VETYAIMRRRVCATREELDEAGERSNAVRAGEMAGRCRWIRSYFFREADGMLGTICIYESESAEAIREHARLARIPADEVLAVRETVVALPDPQATPA
jgi:hypothetical protein